MDEVLEREIVAAVRRFVDRDVIPNASALEHRDEYPHAMVATMRELGLFGATIPADFGGLGLSFTTYARVMEELSRGWMSPRRRHQQPSDHGLRHRQSRHRRAEEIFPAARWPAATSAAASHSPSRTPAATCNRFAPLHVRRGDDYILAGSKMFITNARHGTMLAVAAKTNPHAEPGLRRHQHVRRREERARPHRQPQSRQARLQRHRHLRSSVRGRRGARRQSDRRRRGRRASNK